MRNEYTPAPENVEHSYVAYRSSKVDLITAQHEFMRWLETVRAEAKAEALEEAAAELAQESDAASHMARKLSGDDNTRYHAYSSAYSVAAYKLENRAAQLKGKP